jgi:hypothetical protein
MKFNATNKPGTCLWCGYKAKKDSLFCSNSCAGLFGEAAARNGFRFEPTEGPPPKQRNVYHYPKCKKCGKSMQEVESVALDELKMNCQTPFCDNDWYSAECTTEVVGHITHKRYRLTEEQVVE